MNPTAIQEALLCPFSFEDETHVAVVLRQGRSCILLTILRDVLAAVSTCDDSVARLTRELRLPVRVLDGPEGALLAKKTILAQADGLPHVRL